MSPAAGWLLLVLGLGLGAVAVQGLVRGWLPSGPKGLADGEGVSRAGQPLAFWFFFVLYLGGGFYVSLHAVRMLGG